MANEVTNKTNTNITFRGEPLQLLGSPLLEGETAPRILLTDNNLQDLTWDTLNPTSWKIISVVPSIDTSTCATQSKKLNSILRDHRDMLELITVSLDLPFAQTRWAESERCLESKYASDYKYRKFGRDFGVYINSLGLLTRAVFLLSPRLFIEHVEYVPNISDEPNYEALLDKIKKIESFKSFSLKPFAPKNLSTVEIKSKRLTLKSIEMKYDEEIFKEFTPNVVRFMNPPSPKKISETQSFIKTMLERRDQLKDMVMAIHDNEDGDFIGLVGLHSGHDSRYPELGIWTKESAAGQKLGREAVEMIHGWASNNMTIKSFIYPVVEENVPSVKIAESLGGQILYRNILTNSTGRHDALVFGVPPRMS